MIVYLKEDELSQWQHFVNEVQMMFNLQPVDEQQVYTLTVKGEPPQTLAVHHGQKLKIHCYKGLMASSVLIFPDHILPNMFIILLSVSLPRPQDDERNGKIFTGIG